MLFVVSACSGRVNCQKYWFWIELEGFLFNNNLVFQSFSRNRGWVHFLLQHDCEVGTCFCPQFVLCPPSPACPASV